MKKLKWRKQNAYAITAGKFDEWAIAKYWDDGCTMYKLSVVRNGVVVTLSWSDDPDELREKANKIYNEIQP